MIFNSVEFLLFFPVVTILYFLTPHKLRWALLLFASCLFYMFFKPIYILILGGTIVVDYFAGIYLEKVKKPKSRLILLICSLVANIGVLVFFKYFNFLNNNITYLESFFGYKNQLPFLKIILPIGLSFHTFQAMSYTIEVYRQKQPAEKHFGYYSLYVMYYPQLVAGPIERPQNILYQFHTKHYFDYDSIVSGLKLMLWGLFKKIVVADSLAVAVNAYYSNVFHSNVNPVFVIIFFSFQIYCDFSGYTDIARGASRVMGIELLKNFNYPYFANSVTDFWHRWHISLSTWFRDYLYIPLGGNKNTILYIRNVILVFLISGLWHGANWTFIVWGLIHGVISIIERLLKISKSKTILMRISTFTIVSLTWVFFRADNFSVAMQMFHNLRYSNFDFDKKVLFILLVFIAVEYFTYKSKCAIFFELINKRCLRFALYLFMIDLILFAFNRNTSQQFIYFQF